MSGGRSIDEVEKRIFAHMWEDFPVSIDWPHGLKSIDDEDDFMGEVYRWARQEG